MKTASHPPPGRPVAVLSRTLAEIAAAALAAGRGPAPRITPAALPAVTPYALAEALLRLLRAASGRGLFTSLTNPVWDGWATWRQLAWNLPPALSCAPYAEPEEDAPPECYWNVASLLVEMAEARLVESRVWHPFAHSTDVKAQKYQEWQFRLPGFGGHCYWEPAPPALPPVDDEAPSVTQETWQGMVAPRDRRMFLAAFPDGRLPPYLLAQIGRRWAAKMTRPVGQGRRGCPNFR